VNPIDYKRRAGSMKAFYPIHFPAIIGVDVAGVVVKCGAGVEGFSPGDAVLAVAAHTYAELCVVKASILAKVPRGLDLIEAAALPPVTTTGSQLAATTGLKRASGCLSRALLEMSAARRYSPRSNGVRWPSREC
jgi:NADPH:quinone reductase-like Zn-dependent oxidoreductase